MFTESGPSFSFSHGGRTWCEFLQRRLQTLRASFPLQYQHNRFYFHPNFLFCFYFMHMYDICFFDHLSFSPSPHIFSLTSFIHFSVTLLKRLETKACYMCTICCLLMKHFTEAKVLPKKKKAFAFLGSGVTIRPNKSYCKETITGSENVTDHQPSKIAALDLRNGPLAQTPHSSLWEVGSDPTVIKDAH